MAQQQQQQELTELWARLTPGQKGRAFAAGALVVWAGLLAWDFSRLRADPAFKARFDPPPPPVKPWQPPTEPPAR